MSEAIIKVVYEGNRKKIKLANPTFASLEEAVNEAFGLSEVELVARLKDRTEHDVRDDEEFGMYINTLDVMLVYEYLQNPLEIALGKERHVLYVIPESNSALVRYARNVVIPEFDLPRFVHRLGDSARYVRRSYYHLLACEKHMMAKDVDTLTSTVLKPLMEHCRVTFDLYVVTTREMLQLLQVMFEYARDGIDLHDLAAKNGKYLAEKASRMKNEAGDRVKELTVANDKMEKVVSDVLGKNAEEGDKQSKGRRSLDKKTRKHKQLADSHYPFTWAILKFFGTSDYRRLQNLREEKADLSKSQDELSEIVKYLNDASRSIKQARAIVAEMETFWTKMENAGEGLANDKSFLESTEVAVGADQRARRVRQSRGYKRQALNYMARIVAIRDVSTDCSRQLKLVGADIDAILVEVPTRSQALKKLEEISKAEERPQSAIQYGLEDIDPSTEKDVAEVFSLSTEATD